MPRARPAFVALAVLAAVLGAGCESSDPEAAASAVAADRAEGVTVVYTVEGMTCGNCEKAIETTVAGLPGVLSCDASHEAGTASVVVADESAADAVPEAIGGLGFTVVAN